MTFSRGKGHEIWYSQIGSKIGEYQDEYSQIDIHKSQIGAYVKLVICEQRTGTGEVLEAIPPYLHLEPKWGPKY